MKQNVRRQATSLREQAEPSMLEPRASGALEVVGADYDLDEGRVDFLDRP